MKGWSRSCRNWHAAAGPPSAGRPARASVRGGKPFTKTSLHKLLTNVTYVGKVRHKTELHDGEQPAIVTPEIWQRVQVVLQRNGRNGGAAVRNQFGALLKGLLRCVPCGCAMTPAHTHQEGQRVIAITPAPPPRRTGWHTCPVQVDPRWRDRAVRRGANPLHRPGPGAVGTRRSRWPAPRPRPASTN